MEDILPHADMKRESPAGTRVSRIAKKLKLIQMS